MSRKQLGRKRSLMLLAIASMAGLALLGYLRMSANVVAMRAASRDLGECRRLVAEIAGLQELPQFAALEPDSSTMIGQRIEQANKAAQLPAASLIRIQPQPPFRLGNSEYRLWPTRLELNQVTLEQVARFAHGLADEERGLTVRDLRLWTTSSSSNAGMPESWSSEITLTQVTFSPTSR